MKVAFQTRCVHCGMEQYAMNVPGVSRGESACCWCGEMSRPMTDEEYREAHKQRRAKQQNEVQ